MAKEITPKEEQLAMDWYERTHKHWRSWGSWYSWGSPVGLSIFLLSLVGMYWILSNI